MKLIKLKDCDIYRDGGSLEGIWETDEGKEWAVSLKIQFGRDRVSDFRDRPFKLYNSTMHEKDVNAITKNSPQHHSIISLISDWMSSNNIVLTDMQKEIANNNRFYDLWEALQRGNY